LAGLGEDTRRYRFESDYRLRIRLARIKRLTHLNKINVMNKINRPQGSFVEFAELPPRFGTVRRFDFEDCGKPFTSDIDAIGYKEAAFTATYFNVKTWSDEIVRSKQLLEMVLGSGFISKSCLLRCRHADGSLGSRRSNGRPLDRTERPEIGRRRNRNRLRRAVEVGESRN